MRLLLCRLLVLAIHLALTSAKPMWRPLAQQILSPFSHREKHAPQALYTPSSYLDVRPRAVALALTSGDNKSPLAQCFFLPDGRNVRTHVTPELPLHPRTAHIIGAVDWEGRVVSVEEMEAHECMIFPAWNRTLNPGRKAKEFALRMSSGDGVVDLQDGDEALRLGGREVEAYECRYRASWGIIE